MLDSYRNMIEFEDRLYQNGIESLETLHGAYYIFKDIRKVIALSGDNAVRTL